MPPQSKVCHIFNHLPESCNLSKAWILEHKRWGWLLDHHPDVGTKLLHQVQKGHLQPSQDRITLSQTITRLHKILASWPKQSMPMSRQQFATEWRNWLRSGLPISQTYIWWRPPEGVPDCQNTLEGPLATWAVPNGSTVSIDFWWLIMFGAQESSRMCTEEDIATKRLQGGAHIKKPSSWSLKL